MTRVILAQVIVTDRVNRKFGVFLCCSLKKYSLPVAVVRSKIGSFSNDNGDGNENVTNLHIQWAKTIALHALHVRFSYMSISLPSSAKQQREITKFEALWRTSALGDKFSFFSPKLSAAHNRFIPEGLLHLCHIKKLGIFSS